MYDKEKGLKQRIFNRKERDWMRRIRQHKNIFVKISNADFYIKIPKHKAITLGFHVDWNFKEYDYSKMSDNPVYWISERHENLPPYKELLYNTVYHIGGRLSTCYTSYCNT